MKTNVLRIILALLVLLELGAWFLAASVLLHGTGGTALISVAVIVLAPLLGLLFVVNIYRRVRARG